MGYDFYNEVPAKDVPYPFLSYEMDDSLSDGNATETAFLNIDGWDNYTEAGNTLRLETMMSAVVGVLDKHKKQIDGLSFWFALDKRKSIRDPDATLRRRQLQFQVRILG